MGGHMPEKVSSRVEDDDLLTSSEAAKALGVSASFLAKPSVSGTGPRYVKIGRAVRSRRHDLEQYLRARSRSLTCRTVIRRSVYSSLGSAKGDVWKQTPNPAGPHPSVYTSIYFHLTKLGYFYHHISR